MNLISPIKTKRIAVKLKPSAERMTKKGHPWVFSDSIVKQNAKGNYGDLAIVFDSKTNKFLSCGLYDPGSPIRIKMLQFHESKEINQDWFSEKIAKAKGLRESLIGSETTSYRLIFGENDGLPGVIADVYGDVMVLKLYSLIWAPYLNVLARLLIEACSCSTAVLRLSRNSQTAYQKLGVIDGQVIYGVLEDEVVQFKEHSLHFEANVVKGHKTGFFLDHRHNRKRVGELAKNKHVLDVFCYAGGFSVHALNGGARSVTSVDISAQAIAMAKRNVALNSTIAPERHHVIVSDAFDCLNDLVNNKKKFDLVIIDPPSFAKSKKEIKKAIIHYDKLAELGEKLTSKNGILVLASCSSRIIATDFFSSNMRVLRSSGRFVELVDSSLHDVDHPIAFEEGAYLKCGYYQFFD
jgi:23S rRNA (cytosine1962-C5)-methyltransferase